MSALGEMIRRDGGLLAAAVADPAQPSRYAAAAGARGPEYALLIEAVHEGYLSHYGASRVVVTDDPDLALLAGDRLYALGLATLAELGDLHGVRVLADIISRCAQAHAEGAPDAASAAWEAGVQEITRGA